ncbi:MAG TPA: hypothetical protein PK253_09255 [Spirochaetota bacterium]|nr:hypothetical protein [Spirochaetota bacterium]
MINEMLMFARGPLFVFCSTLMVLGIIRLVVILVINLHGSIKNAGCSDITYRDTVRETAIWMLPLRRLFNTSPVFSTVSFLFHVGVIVVPLFMLEHVLLLENGTGIRLWNIPGNVADTLTGMVLITGCILLLYRIMKRSGRGISSFSHYFILVIILTVFASGYVAASPYNPISYTGMMLCHVLAGNLLLVLIPFSRLSHAIVYPFIRLVTLSGWCFPYGGGKKANNKIFGSEQIEI